MIDLEKDTPIEYSKQSRDYQVFKYVYNALFNQVKMYTDLIRNFWTDDIDNKLLLLRSYTLNFIPYYQWTDNDLRGATNNFKYLMRRKGTKSAIKDCLEILARIKGISLIGTDVQVTDTGLIKLYINEEIADTGNIENLLRYILPAGHYYEIIKYSKQSGDVETDLIVDNSFGLASEGNGGLDSYYYSYDLYLPTDGETYKLPVYTYNYQPGMIITGIEGNLDLTPRIQIYGKTYGAYDPYSTEQSDTMYFNNSEQSVGGSGVSDLVSYIVLKNVDETKFNRIIYNDSIIMSGTDAGVYEGKFDTSKFKALTSEGTEIPDIRFEIGREPSLTITRLPIKLVGTKVVNEYNGHVQSNNIFSIDSPDSSYIKTYSRFVTKARGTNINKNDDVYWQRLDLCLSKIYYARWGEPGIPLANEVLGAQKPNPNFDITIDDGYLNIIPNTNWKIIITINNEEVWFSRQTYYTPITYTAEATGISENDFSITCLRTQAIHAGTYKSNWHVSLLNENYSYNDDQSNIEYIGGKLTIKPIPIDNITINYPDNLTPTRYLYSGKKFEKLINRYPDDFEVIVNTNSSYTGELEIINEPYPPVIISTKIKSIDLITSKYRDSQLSDKSTSDPFIFGPDAGTYIAENFDIFGIDTSSKGSISVPALEERDFEISNWTINWPQETIDTARISIIANDQENYVGIPVEELNLTATISGVSGDMVNPVYSFEVENYDPETSPPGDYTINIIYNPDENKNYRIRTQSGVLHLIEE